jgi:hypothetical protein
VAIDTTKIRAFQNGLVACSAYGVTSPTLPTDATSSLGAQFFDVGSVTDDGITDSTRSTLTQTGTGVTIAEKPPVKDVRAWVLHGISDSGKLQRIVIPLGQVSERGDVVWSSKDITVYELTIKCFVDASGNVAYRYHYDNTLTL